MEETVLSIYNKTLGDARAIGLTLETDFVYKEHYNREKVELILDMLNNEAHGPDLQQEYQVAAVQLAKMAVRKWLEHKKTVLSELLNDVTKSEDTDNVHAFDPIPPVEVCEMVETTSDTKARKKLTHLYMERVAKAEMQDSRCGDCSVETVLRMLTSVKVLPALELLQVLKDLSVNGREKIYKSIELRETYHDTILQNIEDMRKKLERVTEEAGSAKDNAFEIVAEEGISKKEIQRLYDYVSTMIEKHNTTVSIYNGYQGIFINRSDDIILKRVADIIEAKLETETEMDDSFIEMMTSLARIALYLSQVEISTFIKIGEFLDSNKANLSKVSGMLNKFCSNLSRTEG